MENEELVLKIKPIDQIKAVEFNFEEIKKGLEKKLQNYKNLVYTEENIKNAKDDKANLNKLKKAFESERIRIKKEYNEPVVAFEEKIKVLTSMIDEPIEEIDSQIKTYEEAEKEQKAKDIEELFKKLNKTEIKLEQIWNDRWLNKSYSMNQVKEDLTVRFKQYDNDIEAIKQMKSEDEVILIDYYKKELDLSKTLVKKAQLDNEKRLKEEQEKREKELEEQKQKEIAEETQEVAEEVQIVEKVEEETEEKFTLKFAARGTKNKLNELAKYMQENNIEWKQIRG